MMGRVWRAMARFEASLWGDVAGVVCLFAGLWLPLVIGGW